MIVDLFDIISNEKLTKKSEEHEIYSMLIDVPEIAKTAQPGQFVHVKCGNLTLRRPISIASAKNGKIRLCYDVRGEGTAWMSRLKSGEKIDMIGPLGKGFDVSDTSKKVLLVGGGIGIYPLYSVAEVYGENAVTVLGFRTKDIITFEKEFKDCGGGLYIATDDGSYGKKGYATDLAGEILANNKIDIIMTCGPKIMMKGVAEEAVKRSIRCQVSMEERMACGVGACLVCVCRVKGKNGSESKFELPPPCGHPPLTAAKAAEGGLEQNRRLPLRGGCREATGGVLEFEDTFTNRRVCADGPVFDIFGGNEVDWND
ncbi:MAG: dihydroorotate dehydrogenase electron transfer subunit [Oscillospiraceae bacterium]|nr:dihydroorotate dehydrogenase electron transfer subunit [Oscillospiraceae bacterium]